MKKMILMVVAMLSMTMTTFAADETAMSTTSTEAYDMTTNIRRLAVYLDLNFDQMEGVKDVHRVFCAEMMAAAHADEQNRSEMVDKAVEKDLKHMRYILSDKQYRKYLTVLNATMVNRGLTK